MSTSLRPPDALDAVEAALRSGVPGPSGAGGLEPSMLELVINDPVTGLRNRRGLDQAAHSEWRRAARTGEALGLVVVDLGRDAGEAPLAAAGRVLVAAAIRAGDTVGRAGPGRLVALLPACPPAGAVRIAGRLRAAFAEASLAGAGPGADAVRVGSASMVPACGGRPDDLLRAALGTLDPGAG